MEIIAWLKSLKVFHFISYQNPETTTATAIITLFYMILKQT